MRSNLMPVRRVMVAGWPAEFGDEAHAGILGGIEGSLFGGASAVNITFSNAELGREPAAGIALATYAYLHRGAMQPEALAGEITTDNLTE